MLRELRPLRLPLRTQSGPAATSPVSLRCTVEEHGRGISYLRSYPAKRGRGTAGRKPVVEGAQRRPRAETRT
jgi:hypothetical protein